MIFRLIFHGKDVTAGIPFELHNSLFNFNGPLGGDLQHSDIGYFITKKIINPWRNRSRCYSRSILFYNSTVFLVGDGLFFISASVLSKYKSAEKTSASLDFEKGTTKRDAMQVVANGTVALILVVGYGFFDLLPLLLTNQTVIPQITSPFFVGVFIAFAVHNADTWATEIGLLSNRKPRLVTNLRKQVMQGTSGGITIDGLAASLFGAMVIAGVYFSAYLTIPPNSHDIFMIGLAMGVITIAGLIGSVVDSIEGATIQGIYYCEPCAKETESNPHPRCGNPTTLIRGNIVINNDIVNVSSAFIVAILGIIIILLIRF
ncbi:MAG: DUF92 domain-containing protein [Candidatus Heimdallarchaeota archaeon]